MINPYKKYYEEVAAAAVLQFAGCSMNFVSLLLLVERFYHTGSVGSGDTQ